MRDPESWPEEPFFECPYCWAKDNEQHDIECPFVDIPDDGFDEEDDDDIEWE